MKLSLKMILLRVIRLWKRVLRVPTPSDAQIEYTKSRHRCPICGTLVGCDSSGNTWPFSTKMFYKHLVQCRRLNRVKTGRIRYEEER